MNVRLIIATVLTIAIAGCTKTVVRFIEPPEIIALMAQPVYQPSDGIIVIVRNGTPNRYVLDEERTFRIERYTTTGWEHYGYGVLGGERWSIIEPGAVDSLPVPHSLNYDTRSVNGLYRVKLYLFTGTSDNKERWIITSDRFEVVQEPRPPSPRR